MKGMLSEPEINKKEMLLRRGNWLTGGSTAKGGEEERALSTMKGERAGGAALGLGGWGESFGGTRTGFLDRQRIAWIANAVNH